MTGGRPGKGQLWPEENRTGRKYGQIPKWPRNKCVNFAFDHISDPAEFSSGHYIPDSRAGLTKINITNITITQVSSEGQSYGYLFPCVSPVSSRCTKNDFSLKKKKKFLNHK